MPDLVILGIGPHAVEIADIAGRINGVKDSWNLVGFASFHGESVGEELLGLPILGWPAALECYPTAHVVPEYEWPRKSELPRHRLATLIDPTVFVSRSAHIGLGCVIYPHCYVGSHARIGDFLFCLAGSVINHEDVIEDGVTITSSVTIAGNVHVEADCYLGQSCTIREMTRIGRGSLIGIGCVVLRDVAPNSVMVGNPGRRLRAREPRTVAAKAWRRAKRAARRRAGAARRRVFALMGNAFAGKRP